MTLRERIELAAILEVLARKPGNVYPGQERSDLSVQALLASAVAIGPILAESAVLGVAQAVLAAIRATSAVAPSNTNLGIVLLFAPLAAAAGSGAPLGQILASLGPAEAALVYQAIREAKPGGMGRVAEADVSEVPSIGLVDAMRLAADRDTIARQYANNFADLRALGSPAIAEGVALAGTIEDAIVWCHLRWMASFADSLIARVHGKPLAEETRRRAQRVLNCMENRPCRDMASHSEVRGLNTWLTSDPWKNPGTSADLVAASLFCFFQNGGSFAGVPWS